MVVFLVFLWWCLSWCFCVGVVVFLWCCGCVFVVVFLWWCFSGRVFAVVFLWWCFFLWWWCGCVFVVVFWWLCFCGGVAVVFLLWCGGVFVDPLCKIQPQPTSTTPQILALSRQRVSKRTLQRERGWSRSSHSSFQNLQGLLRARGAPDWAVALSGSLQCK